MVRKKSIMAAMSTIMFLTSVLVTPAYAEEDISADKPTIDLVFENAVGEKRISEEDAKAIAEAYNLDCLDARVVICGEDTGAGINWKNSSILFDEVIDTNLICPELSKDEKGNLIVEQEVLEVDGVIYSLPNHTYLGGAGWCGSYTEAFAITEGSYFDIREEKYHENTDTTEAINSHLGKKSFLRYDEENECLVQHKVNDVYIIEFLYTVDGLGNLYASNGSFYDERKVSSTGFLILPEGVETALNFEEDSEESGTDSDTQYTVDLTTSTEPIANDKFEKLLEENKTKDLVINSGNGITFTFKVGTMEKVDGKTSYDFSASLDEKYADTMPEYITKDNFVMVLNFNYSGKLPAEANIRFFVGTQYAGKTLYYSLMNDDKTFSEVQEAVVDAEGYMTVKQNHCSSYVITTTKPLAKAPVIEETTTEEIVTPPVTGDNTFVITYVLTGILTLMLLISVEVKRNKV